MFDSLHEGLEEYMQMIKRSAADETVRQNLEMWAATVMKYA